MIIQSYDHCYEVLREIDSESRMSEFVCKEQQQQEAYLLVKISEPTLAKRFTFFLEEKVKRSGFPDFKECFRWNGAFYCVFTYSSEQTLADKIAAGHCDRKERAEIVRRLLEQMLLRVPHPYFMRNSLRPDMITVADSLDVDWNYHLDEVRTFDYCTIKAVDIRLMEVMKFLFEEELSKGQYPPLDHYLSVLGEGKMSDYLGLYREFMPVYQALCEKGQKQVKQTFLQRLWEVCKKTVKKPDSLKGYLRLGKRYVAKKLAIVFTLLVVLFSLALLWIVYPWVQSRFLPKTMVICSQETEGYTGRVRLVGDLEADNVIFAGTLTEGQINGQGTLYDGDGNLIYRGEFLADQYSGIGESYYQNGNVEYSGEFSRGLYDGTGILYYPDGQIQYRGGFSQGLFEGVGVLYHENGVASYEGEFLQGKRSGSGKAYDGNGELVYDGSFSQDRYEGEGILYENGEVVCQGSFHQDILTSGTAVYHDRQGNLLYQGEIDNGLYDGEGKLFSEGILVYEGSFAEGKYHGSGKEYQETTGMLLYDGTFEQGKYSGEGRLYDEVTGSLLYEGSFYKNLYDGEGKLYDPVDGYLIYEGSFRDGLYDGKGKSYTEGILAYEGEFFLGAYNGRGILFDRATGTVAFEGVFYDNEPIYIPVEPDQVDGVPEMAAVLDGAE